jgi:hypothetical protein
VLRGARRLLRSGQVRALQLEVSPFHLEKQNCSRAKITNLLRNADFTPEFKCTKACGRSDDQQTGELIAFHNTVPRRDTRPSAHVRSGLRMGTQLLLGALNVREELTRLRSQQLADEIRRQLLSAVQ